MAMPAKQVSSVSADQKVRWCKEIWPVVEGGLVGARTMHDDLRLGITAEECVYY